MLIFVQAQIPDEFFCNGCTHVSCAWVQALDEDQPGSKVLYKKLFEEDREYNQGKHAQLQPAYPATCQAITNDLACLQSVQQGCMPGSSTQGCCRYACLSCELYNRHT